MLAANAWLFTSPDETLRPEFQARPVVRGAVGLSVRDCRLFAYFKTLRDPMLGAAAPPLLAQMLKSGETSLMLATDRNGFLIEVGWPWDTRFDLLRAAGRAAPLAPASGSASTAGC